MSLQQSHALKTFKPPITASFIAITGFTASPVAPNGSHIQASRGRTNLISESWSAQDRLITFIAQARAIPSQAC